jgi:hypothetical protein
MTAKKQPEIVGANVYSVFVSHATADKWIAMTLCEKIDAVGAKTFRDDRDISGGDAIPEAIRRALVRSAELVVLITPASVNRPWVLIEIGAMWGRRKNSRIIPVVYHVDVANIPEQVRLAKAVPLNEFDGYLDQLAKRVEKAGVK